MVRLYAMIVFFLFLFYFKYSFFKNVNHFFFSSLYWICYNTASVFWLWVVWDLSSLTRDRTSTPCLGEQSRHHWTFREVPYAIMFSTWDSLSYCILIDLLVLRRVKWGIIHMGPSTTALCTDSRCSVSLWCARDPFHCHTVFVEVSRETWSPASCLPKLAFLVVTFSELASLSGSLVIWLQIHFCELNHECSSYYKMVSDHFKWCQVGGASAQ